MGKTIVLPGTVRSESPGATLSRIESIARKIGITRVANVTGLDTIGVPVWIAVRPLAKSLSVSQGKGMTHELAKCSAIMESIETYHAEQVRPFGVEMPLTEFTNNRDLVNPLRLALHRDAEISEDFTPYWVRGEDIISGKDQWIPHDLFNLDFTRKRLAPPLFISSSNGLASGNTFTEAILHGLCETIERDQLSLWLVRSRSGTGGETSIRLDTINDLNCQYLIETCKRAGVEIFVWYVRANPECRSFSARLLMSSVPLRIHNERLGLAVILLRVLL